MIDEASVVSSLVANAPVGGAVILTVLLFLKRQKEQGDEFRATLGQIIDTQSKRDEAMAAQVGRIANELTRLSDRLDEHDNSSHSRVA